MRKSLFLPSLYFQAFLLLTLLVSTLHGQAQSAIQPETEQQSSLSLNTQLSKQLKLAFPTLTTSEINEAPAEYNTIEFPFSNENHLLFFLRPFPTAIYDIQQQLPDLGKSSNPRIAILVGQSFLNVLLPTLSEKVNHIIFLDISNGMLNYNMFYIKILQHWARNDYPEGKLNINTLSEYRKKLATTLTFVFYFQDQSWTGYLMRFFSNSFLDSETYSILHSYHDRQMPDLSMFDNFDNMKQVMETIQSISFSPVRINLASKTNMKKFGDILKEQRAKVMLFNVSNAYEWVHLSEHDYFKSIDYLSHLPLESKNGLFIHSCLKFCDFFKHVDTDSFTDIERVKRSYNGHAQHSRYWGIQ
ncbi:hypothetical protein EOPP23_04295 [Endozoicomonas sp. OPT23]|uniref:hypothetical protein n=1 Tax=Endozoicomonas sp. OPT23 TaxID=2072845 RepID=UPI00129AA1AC|nr:hypothetical protein [Endozoicomonas sp. OPT23]MRI32216.1 hypothetical protein [Endozoicomonas sp. OPT23]